MPVRHVSASNTPMALKRTATAHQRTGSEVNSREHSRTRVPTRPVRRLGLYRVVSVLAGMAGSPSQQRSSIYHSRRDRREIAMFLHEACRPSTAGGRSGTEHPARNSERLHQRAGALHALRRR